MIRFLFLSFCFSLFAQDEIVIATKQIILHECPDAFNPSLLKTDDGFLLIFRYSPDRVRKSNVSYIGVVSLDENFDPISPPQFLSTRGRSSKTSSQSEDPRIFTYRGRNFVIYNDNMEFEAPTFVDRRDMYLAELFQSEGQFSLSSPIKLHYKEKYNTSWWQKNWFPFEWEKKLFLVYTICPHEVISPNLSNGNCYSEYRTTADLEWEWGTLRGSTPAFLVDGEYLSFFHSGAKMASSASWGQELWHYFMGAYTFSPEPPFHITKITPAPIIGNDFYTLSYNEKRVIFPGGYFVNGPHIYVAYGKDDEEMWIATLDKAALFQFLKPVKNEGVLDQR